MDDLIERSEAIIERLDALIAAQQETAAQLRRLRVAQLDQWLDAEDVGVILGYGPSQVRERFACRPGFPKPLRVDGGHPRWRASAVQAWAEAEQSRTGGRKRRSTTT